MKLFEINIEAGRKSLHITLLLFPICVFSISDYYAPECDGAVRFDDPDIGIDWGIDNSEAVLSEKDAAAPLLKDFDSPFTFEG